MPRREIAKQSNRLLQKPATGSHSSSSPRNTTQRRSSSVKPSYKRPVQAPKVLKSSGRQVIRSSSFAKGFGGTQSGHPSTTLRTNQVRKASRVDRLAKGLLIVGFLLLAVYGGLRINQEIQLSYVTPQVTSVERNVESEEETYAAPTQITISKIGLELPVIETAINNGVWEISPNGASYLKISARPGENGTIIMYGHNTRSRFGPIRWLEIGERIDVQTADGKNHTYTITNTMQVSPDSVDVLTKEKGETLILYTCDGFADLQRYVIVAKPVR